MGFTKRSDLIIPELLTEAVQGEFEGMTLMNGSGIAVVANDLPDSARGGDRVKVPYFDTLGEAEDITNEGDALTPEPLSMSEEEAVVVHSGKAFETTEWARMAAKYADPYKEAARQLRELVQRRADKALVTVATASLPAAYIHDVYHATIPVTLGYDVMVDAKQKWGDEQGDIVQVGVHSKVYGDLAKVKATDGMPIFTQPEEGKPARIAGVSIKVSDKCIKGTEVLPTLPSYESIIGKRAALAFWFCGTPVIKPFEDELAHTSGIAVHFYWAAHRFKRVRGGTKPGIVKIKHN